MRGVYEKALQKGLQTALRKKKEVIVTDPRTTRKGNTTCMACKLAAKRGTPHPPDHPNCRCKLIGAPTNY